MAKVDAAVDGRVYVDRTFVSALPIGSIRLGGQSRWCKNRGKICTTRERPQTASFERRTRKAVSQKRRALA